jgi:peptidoglycan hydrolase-like protein with peptidoglycan-binding domain
VRVVIGALLASAVVFGGLVVAALAAWPAVGLRGDDAALAHVVVPRFTGHVVDVRAVGAGRSKVPVKLLKGKVWPRHKLAAGERLTVEVTVRRPRWAGWLVGRDEHRSLTLVTPVAQLRGRWLELKQGAPVTVSFDHPVRVVSLGNRVHGLQRPRKVVPVGLFVRGSDAVGSIQVAAAARSWERLPAPVRVTWFPAQPFPQLLAEPRPGLTITPDHRFVLTFSRPVADVLGSERPQLSPETPGRWRLLDDHTIAFRPSGLGFSLGSTVQLAFPRPIHAVGQAAAALTRTLTWHVPAGSTLRLQQLLAQLGYLPLSWQPATDPPNSTRAQLAAAIAPPPGRFDWRYPDTPPELRALWDPGQIDQITRGAVMMFQDEHDLTVDAIAGPRVWRQLLEDVLAGKQRTDGYSYVYVHRNVPQSLNLWHNGQTILSSPGNTGVPAAPTARGTFPVFEHIPIGRMSGTNPDGTHYNDPGIRYISYFHGGDAIHAFNRSSFGTPQSLGCVELPLAAAARVWPYTPIGTLVTIEN